VTTLAVPLTSLDLLFSPIFGGMGTTLAVPLTSLALLFSPIFVGMGTILAVPLTSLTTLFLTYIWWNRDNPGCSVDVLDLPQDAMLIGNPRGEGLDVLLHLLVLFSITHRQTHVGWEHNNNIQQTPKKKSFSKLNHSES
jgi:hypothetical protein